MTHRTIFLSAALLACLAVAGWAGSVSGADAAATVAVASPAETALASELGSGYRLHLSRSFAFVYNRNEEFIRAGAELLEGAQADFYDLYREAGFDLAASDQRHVWICFSSRTDFERYARRSDHSPLSWLSEYYSARTNRVTIVREQIRSGRRSAVQTVRAHDSQVLAKDATVTAPARNALAEADGGFELHGSDVTRLTHESAHQFSFNSGLLARGVSYPMWVAEGLATHFEADNTGLTGRGSRNNSRRDRLTDASGRGALQPLSSFITMIRPPQGGEAVSDAYAQSWALYSFLFEKHKAELKTYLAAMAAKGPGTLSAGELREEFVRAFGSVRVVEAEWQEYVAGLVEGR